jgi:hypothetical protein
MCSTSQQNIQMKKNQSPDSCTRSPMFNEQGIPNSTITSSQLGQIQQAAEAEQRAYERAYNHHKDDPATSLAT